MSFCRRLVSVDASDGRMSLLRASGGQQLQHLPLQEVPRNVRGTEADGPVQVWEINWIGPKGHPFSSHVSQILIRRQRRATPRRRRRAVPSSTHSRRRDGRLARQKEAAKLPKITHCCSFDFTPLALAGELPRLRSTAILLRRL